MISFLNVVAKMLPPVAWLVLCVGLIVVTTTQSVRLSVAIGDSATHEANSLNCQSANTTNTKTIDELSRANKACIAGREVDRAKTAAASAQLNEFIKRVESESENLKPQTDLLNEDCKKLLAIDVAAACPDVAASMLKHATLYNSD